jgi:prepilin peptidase CpaA
MNSIVWWSTLSLVTTAALIDLRCRRIPNWLVMPFSIAGIAFGFLHGGSGGLAKSLGGIGLATVAAGILCWLRAMGMGDLKLCAAVGAWVGFAQLGVALLMTGMAGAILAVLWAAQEGALKHAIEGAVDLVFGFWRRGLRPHPTLNLDNPVGHKMPYAPAIAIGTVVSFYF